MSDVTLILGAVVLTMLLPAFVFGGIAWNRVRWLRISQNWERTDGRVVETSISSRSSGRGRRRYYPHVIYKFKVNRRTYSGERLHFGLGFNSTNRKRVEAFLEQYPLERPLEIYYDPADPTRNVVERTTPDTRTYWIVAAAWVFFAVLFALMSVWVSVLFEN